MKRLITIIMFLAFLVLPLSANASCSNFMNGLVDQCFMITVDEIDFKLCFGGTVVGPCPAGIATLEYVDVQIINDVEYSTILTVVFDYTTNQDYVTIAGIDFILVNGQLIEMPENPLIFDLIED